ncbi:MAG: extracellular solute-binding protein [Chloroflexi bacterium]|nr:extracellular solute-binding protein [Chloroflexota bacterium]
MKRNRLVIFALLVLVLTLGIASARPAFAQIEPFALTDPASGARPFEGQTLRIINTEVVPILAYEHEVLDAAYVEASGVILDYTNYDQGALLPVLQTMCAAQGDDYDIMFVEDGWAGALEALDCLEPLEPYYMAAPGDSHPEDYTLRAFGTVAMHNETWYGMPTLVAVGMFAYRTDLFSDPDEQAAFQAQYGRELRVPETWDELMEVGQFFTRPDQNLYGFNYRYGTPNNILFDYMIHFGFSRGVNFFDANFTPLFNTEAALDAAAFFTGADFLALQPPGRESFQFGEVLQNFTQGVVAMYGTESWAIPLLLDPEASTVSDVTGFAPIPGWRNPETGEVQRALLSAGPAYMVNRNISPERKRLAWDYLQLAHGMQFARLLAEQYGAGHRISVLTDPELVAQYPHLTANYIAMQVGIGRPSTPWWPEAENALGQGLQAAVAGTPVEEAMGAAQAEVERIVAENGYNDGTFTYVTVEQREVFVCQLFARIGVSSPECGT